MSEPVPVVWIVVPAVLGVLLYSSLALCMWPYARPVLPFYLLLFGILFPPFFPFLFFYVLFAIILFPRPAYVPERNVVVIVDESARGRTMAVPSYAARSNATRGNRV